MDQSKGVDPGAIGQKAKKTTLDGIQAAWMASSRVERGQRCFELACAHAAW